MKKEESQAFHHKRRKRGNIRNNNNTLKTNLRNFFIYRECCRVIKEGLKAEDCMHFLAPSLPPDLDYFYEHIQFPSYDEKVGKRVHSGLPLYLIEINFC
jgi:hypothetical protein